MSPLTFVPQLFHLIHDNKDYVKQIAKQAGWQDVLTKLYVKESYASHAAGIVDPGSNSSIDPKYQPSLHREKALTIEDAEIFLSYRTSQDIEDEEEDEVGQRDISEGFSDLSQSPPSGGPLKTFTGTLNFKSFDSADQGSLSSSISNTLDNASFRPDEEGRDYHPLSPFDSLPFDLEQGSMMDTGTHTPAGSLTNTPSPLEQSKPFPPLRPRKSSSLSNVLDDNSYGKDPSGDTISNTSNPQVRALNYFDFFFNIFIFLCFCVYYSRRQRRSSTTP